MVDVLVDHLHRAEHLVSVAAPFRVLVGPLRVRRRGVTFAFILRGWHHHLDVVNDRGMLRHLHLDIVVHRHMPVDRAIVVADDLVDFRLHLRVTAGQVHIQHPLLWAVCAAAGLVEQSTCEAQACAHVSLPGAAGLRCEQGPKLANREEWDENEAQAEEAAETHHAHPRPVAVLHMLVHGIGAASFADLYHLLLHVAPAISHVGHVLARAHLIPFVKEAKQVVT
mmetsp:Transcript_74078/g.176668  ORF Transcript_74078/g.176668 Transcript_74078/m.176668 type:complete len:224 (-) Transcript_74078:221-892(-)